MGVLFRAWFTFVSCCFAFNLEHLVLFRRFKISANVDFSWNVRFQWSGLYLYSDGFADHRSWWIWLLCQSWNYHKSAGPTHSYISLSIVDAGDSGIWGSNNLICSFPNDVCSDIRSKHGSESLEAVGALRKSLTIHNSSLYRVTYWTCRVTCISFSEF